MLNAQGEFKISCFQKFALQVKFLCLFRMAVLALMEAIFVGGHFTVYYFKPNAMHFLQPHTPKKKLFTVSW